MLQYQVENSVVTEIHTKEKNWRDTSNGIWLEQWFSASVPQEFFLSSPKDMLLDFTERGRKEKHQWERETSIGCLSYASWPGTEPATQACAQTGNGTCSPLVYKIILQPTEPHYPGQEFFRTCNTWLFSLRLSNFKKWQQPTQQ